MLGNLSQIPWLKPVVIGLIGIVVISFFFMGEGNKPKSEAQQVQAAIDQLYGSLGQVTAEEATKVLGTGSAVLVIAGKSDAEFKSSAAGTFEAALKKGLKGKYVGYVLASPAPPPDAFAAWAEARQKHAGATLIISTLVPPEKVDPSEESYDKNGPRIFHVEFSAQGRAAAERLMQKGIIPAALLLTQDIALTAPEKGKSAQEIVARYYKATAGTSAQ